MSLNKAQIIGRLGQEPELRYTGSGTAVCNLSIATDESYTNDGERVEQTEWHSVTCWARLAETVNEYLEKGRQVYVEGSLKTREWEDRDGDTRYSTEIHADMVQFLDGGTSDQRTTGEAPSQSHDPSPQQPQDAQPGATATQGQDTFEPDSELPF